jgi:asparagine synthase (glutamine-hydrolysing)
MCGVASIFSYKTEAPLIDQRELLRIREAMAKRGPDGEGLWVSENQRIGLAHRRLSIIDLSESGAQPMASADGKVRIVFNGEIYNYRDLRGELEKLGHRFVSTSDTEVLLHLYRRYGRDMVQRLRGMYAFALWDEDKRALFLARDPFGIKPLYYSDDGNTIRVASQVKALLKGGGIDATPEPAGHVGFLLWGFVPEPHTLYRNIRSLPAGTCMWIDSFGRKETSQFFNPTDELAKASSTRSDTTRAEMHERLHDALLDSVRHHLIADVPVGVFLSSGLDSTTLASLARATGIANLHTITLGFREFQGTEYDETILAAVVAQRLGSVHQTRWVAKTDFENGLGALVDAMDQPSIDGINTYFVSKVAAEAGMKVVLSGLGGDEIFGGYPSFKDIPRLVNGLRLLPGLPRLGKAIRWVSAPFLKRFTSPKYAGVLEYCGSYGSAYLLRRGLFMPWELPQVMDPDFAREGWDKLQTIQKLESTTEGIDDDALKISALELTWYMRNQLLRDSDWAGMAHSLEIRVPLVDITLFRKLLPMLTANPKPTKRDMALAKPDLLPPEVLAKPKTGFSVPVEKWVTSISSTNRISDGLRQWARSLLAPYQVDKRMLVLAPDAFGGHGGIAQYNQDLISALSSYPECAEVVAIPRRFQGPREPLPAKLTYLTDGAKGKLSFLIAVMCAVVRRRKYHLIICGHINLLPVAYLCSRLCRAPLVLLIYGIDAWHPTRSRLVNFLATKADLYVSPSIFTRDRFSGWSGTKHKNVALLPNAIHSMRYGSGPPNPKLLKRYGFSGNKILMTLGRMSDSERYKGFDEVLEVLPGLVSEIPNLAYLIVGDGTDRKRLEEKTRALGLESRVVFSGNVAESEKADHYRLADAYVMPSYGEGFGFVFLEAMASGIPVVASSIDGSREAVLDGALGILVDPRNREDLRRGILEALARPKAVPTGLDYFLFGRFEQRCHSFVRAVLN